MTAVDLHAVVDGPAGAPAVLLGGSLGTTRAMWDPQIPALSRGRRVVSYDHRGHGDSPAPTGPYDLDALGGDVLALMDRLELERAAFVGLSIGGMVGQWLAIHAPRRITALVVICSSAEIDAPEPWLERARAVRAAGTPEVVADAVVGRWFTADYAASHPDVVARHRAMIAATPAEGYASCCEAIATLALLPELGDVRAPTLVIAGAQDEALPAAHGRRIALLDPAAHLSSVERADAVTALVADHLDRAVA